MQFIPILKPVLERGVDEIIYDDIRETCETALATLKQVMGAAAEKEEISVSFKQMQVRKYGSREIPPLPLPSVVCTHPRTFAPPPPASGHPRAHQPPLGRGTSPPAWDGRLDAPGQRQKAFAFLCVDSTQRSETGQVRGLRWHNRPREREGKECGEADGHGGLQRQRPREGKGEVRGKVRARTKRKVKGW